MVIPLTCRNLYWSRAIWCKISSSGYKPSSWLYLTSISFGVWWYFFHIYVHEVRHNKPKLDKYCVTQLIDWWNREYWPHGYFSLHILRKIPEKLQVMIQVSLQIIIIKRSCCRSQNNRHSIVRPARERLFMNCTHFQFPRDFDTYQT